MRNILMGFACVSNHKSVRANIRVLNLDACFIKHENNSLHTLCSKDSIANLVCLGDYMYEKENQGGLCQIFKFKYTLSFTHSRFLFSRSYVNTPLFLIISIAFYLVSSQSHIFTIFLVKTFLHSHIFLAHINAKKKTRYFRLNLRDLMLLRFPVSKIEIDAPLTGKKKLVVQ